MDANQVIADVEDHLVPRLSLDVGEARLYYHLFRHSRLLDKHDVLISVMQVAQVLNCSKNVVKPRLRSLQAKGIIEVTNTGWTGTRIKVFLPREIPGVVLADVAPEAVDIEAIDFYMGVSTRAAILERERGRCFYCRRALTDEDAGLDHVDPQRANGANSYRNVVAACHSCNSSKGDNAVEEFVRGLYRRGFLGANELVERLVDIDKLMNGLLRPIV